MALIDAIINMQTSGEIGKRLAYGEIHRGHGEMIKSCRLPLGGEIIAGSNPASENNGHTASMDHINDPY